MTAVPDRIAQLGPLVRGIVASRVADPDDVDDLVQETLTRLLEASERLETRTLASYAVVSARNLVSSLERRRAMGKRHAPNLYDPRAPEDPQETALRAEERQALLTALGRLREEERQALVERDLLEVPTSKIAKRASTTPGAAATRLARARARLRVEYLIALRNISLPTKRCRPVLYALASGDRTRQFDLDAAEHLESCHACGSLAEPVLARSRRLAGLAPLVFIRAAMRSLRGVVRNHPVAASAGAAAVGVAVVAIALQGPSNAPPPARQPSPPGTRLTIGGQPAYPVAPDFPWRRHGGDAVDARGVPVESVPSDEAFWLGTAPRSRVFVVLVGSGESPIHIRQGDRVSLRGRLVRTTPSVLRLLSLSEGRRFLARQGFHVEVDVDSVHTRHTASP